MRPTSIAAKIKAEPRMGSNRARVNQYIIDQMEVGATDQEIQAALRMSGDTLRPTRLSLLKDGLIYESGKLRKNANGNECIVWMSSNCGQIGFF
jgi:hypothetical protein